MPAVWSVISRRRSQSQSDQERDRGLLFKGGVTLQVWWIYLLTGQSLLKLRWILYSSNKDKGMRRAWRRRSHTESRRKGGILQQTFIFSVSVSVWELLRGFICLHDETTRNTPASGVPLQTRPYLTPNIQRRPGADPTPPGRARLLLPPRPVRNCDAAVIEIICRSFSPANLDRG